MKRPVIVTLERVGSRGGIERYLQALVKTYPEMTLERTSPQYPAIFSAFWKHPDASSFFIHEILPVGTACWLMNFTSRRPYVIFLHGMDFRLATRNPWKRFLTKQILHGARSIVVNSEHLREEVLGRFPIFSEKIIVVYPPVDDALVEASLSTRKNVGFVDLKKLVNLAAKELGIPVDLSHPPREADPVKLLTVARLVERKGHLKVLEAMAEIPDVTYTIVGNGPMKPSIEERIRELGLTSRVTMIPDADDQALPELYAQADIFVMPVSETAFDQEGFGIVYLEANLFGLPVIGTRSGGVPESVIDGETGMLVHDSAAEITKAMRELVQDSALRAKLGSAGRARVMNGFTREVQMRKLHALVSS